MRQSRNAVVGLALVLFATGATAQVAATFEVQGLGAVHVRYEPVSADAQLGHAGQLLFFLGGTNQSFLSLPADVDLQRPALEVMDLNGDGYNDVVFYRTKSGYGGSPTRGGDALIYAPAQRTFVKSQTLSDRGELSPGKPKGCAKVEFKSSPAGYTREQWCFNQERGRWRLQSREVEEAE